MDIIPILEEFDLTIFCGDLLGYGKDIDYCLDYVLNNVDLVVAGNHERPLFPIHVPIKTSTENIDPIERIALSIGLSIALVPMIGLLLNYTPWGIRLTPIVLSLFALTLISATAAVSREHKTCVH